MPLPIVLLSRKHQLPCLRSRKASPPTLFRSKPCAARWSAISSRTISMCPPSCASATTSCDRCDLRERARPPEMDRGAAASQQGQKDFAHTGTCLCSNGVMHYGKLRTEVICAYVAVAEYVRSDQPFSSMQILTYSATATYAQ